MTSILTETKIRVYVAAGKVVRCDGDYTKKATDLRYIVIPAAEYDIRAVGRTGAKPSELAREYGAIVAINFPYVNDTDGALIGQAIVEGKPLSYETAKTAGRYEFYRDASGYKIGDARGLVVDFAVQGSPELLRGGRVVVSESVKRDQTGADIISGRAQRTAVGLRKNGDVVFVVSDGRLTSDIGLTLEELALVMRDELACTDAINGDGGGSSIMYVGGKVVNQRSNRENERTLGCALIAVKKPAEAAPKPTLKVVIDAGHGPNTAGKRCPDDSMREFHFNSVVARYVRDELAKYAGVETLFTHADDGSRDVPLSERVKAANDWGADVFVSIHANAFGSGWNSAGGIETFVATSPSAISVKLAENVQKALVVTTGRNDRGVKRADFYVVYKTKMPAILAECGFMTHQAEAALLKTDAYRRKCAGAIVAGIVETFGIKRKETEVSKLAPVSVVVNGKEIADGHIVDGVTYVPVRSIAEALGAKIAWDQKTRTVTLNTK